MMYYKNQVPNLFYKLKYYFTVYDQFFYDALWPRFPCLRFTLIRFSQLLPYLLTQFRPKLVQKQKRIVQNLLHFRA